MEKILAHKYEVLHLIGSGGMGEVYLARDLNLDRLVAVKESKNDFLILEAGLLKELEHKGLPGIYDCFAFGGSIYLVMEYIEGMSLRQYLDKHKAVPEGQAVKWAVELCGIMEYLHERHPAVIYRDLKPENIMIRQNGELKLIDFGSAFRQACGGKKEEMCMGTVGYSPKEQWHDARGDVTWDIYGLGAVLHEMLTGANPAMPPYERRPLGEYNRSLSKCLESIIMKCTAENAEDRYQSVSQLKEELLLCHKFNFLAAGQQAVRKLLPVFMAGCSAFWFIAPLTQGVPENHIPFPYLEKPLIFLMATLIVYLILLRQDNKKRCLCRQEKNIWLTEKKFAGLFSIFLLVFTGISAQSADLWPQACIYAEEEETRLWVEMRDDQGRKMLLKEGAVYKTDKSVRFELPADRLPMQKLALKLVAVGEDGNTYSSRIFYLLAAKEEGG